MTSPEDKGDLAIIHFGHNVAKCLLDKYHIMAFSKEAIWAAYVDQMEVLTHSTKRALKINGFKMLNFNKCI